MSTKYKHVEDTFKDYGSRFIFNQSHEEEGWLQTNEREPISYSFAKSLSLEYRL
ncbi:hypothetical protein ACOI1C_10615 [Bacillus sp. DJP31]|uniref:hypothetical protein n=1 Tax=Bacillus sp. DJP31 TaxID=3409789 RepID=UPI003BB81618